MFFANAYIILVISLNDFSNLAFYDKIIEFYILLMIMDINHLPNYRNFFSEIECVLTNRLNYFFKRD